MIFGGLRLQKTGMIDGLVIEAPEPLLEPIIAYGNGRRMEAVKALEDMGIAQPAWRTL